VDYSGFGIKKQVDKLFLTRAWGASRGNMQRGNRGGLVYGRPIRRERKEGCFKDLKLKRGKVVGGFRHILCKKKLECDQKTPSRKQIRERVNVLQKTLAGGT